MSIELPISTRLARPYTYSVEGNVIKLKRKVIKVDEDLNNLTLKYLENLKKLSKLRNAKIVFFREKKILKIIDEIDYLREEIACLVRELV
jgi:hypothetical protein